MISDNKLVFGTDVSLAATAADVVLANQLGFKVHDLGASHDLAMHVHVKTAITVSAVAGVTVPTVAFNLGTAGGFTLASTGAIPTSALLANTHWFARFNPWPQADPSQARVPTDSDVITIYCVAYVSPDRATATAKGNMAGTVTIDVVEMPSVSARVFPAVQY